MFLHQLFIAGVNDLVFPLLKLLFSFSLLLKKITALYLAFNIFFFGKYLQMKENNFDNFYFVLMKVFFSPL